MKIYIPLLSSNFDYFWFGIWVYIMLPNTLKYENTWLYSILRFLWCFIPYTSIRRAILQKKSTINCFNPKFFNHLLTFQHVWVLSRITLFFLLTTPFLCGEYGVVKGEWIPYFHNIFHILWMWIHVFYWISFLIYCGYFPL